MPQAGILKHLNDNIYKALKPAIQGAIDTIPLGGYINKGLEYGSNMLDTYVPYKQKNIKGQRPKNQLKYNGYYEDDEAFDNKRDFSRYYN
ncbi:hypothetical protein QTN25_004802 [Entamoeba marina]